MTNVPGYSDNCVHSPSTDPAPPKSSLQGDSGTPHNGYLLRDGNHSTSRGGNTSAPGGKIMAPKPLPKGTSGRAVGSQVRD